MIGKINLTHIFNTCRPKKTIVQMEEHFPESKIEWSVDNTQTQISWLELNTLYNELIMAVQAKHANETRHQTALRYIKEREEMRSITDSVRDKESKIFGASHDQETTSRILPFRNRVPRWWRWMEVRYLCYLGSPRAPTNISFRVVSAKLYRRVSSWIITKTNFRAHQSQRQRNSLSHHVVHVERNHHEYRL